MFDVVSLGELLIDFTEKKNFGLPMIFQANAGGAPANVLAQLSKLGKKTAFIGKVGNDIFGKHLISTLQSLNINTDNVLLSQKEFTTLAFVSLDDTGNRTFSFSRNNSADVMLNRNEINFDLIKNSKIFHCGTLSLTNPISKDATLAALETAKENKVLVSVDPNLRLNLWENEEAAKNAIKTVLNYADILKISDYEINFIYGDIDYKTAAEKLFNEFNPKIIFITCGKDGAHMAINKHFYSVACIEEINAIDTTGAGDCFCAAALSGLLEQDLNIESLSDEDCQKILNFANTAANISTLKFGAIPSLPTKTEIEKFLK